MEILESSGSVKTNLTESINVLDMMIVLFKSIKSRELPRWILAIGFREESKNATNYHVHSYQESIIMPRYFTVEYYEFRQHEE
jgi:hypothetical protein